ncbi:MAG: ATP-binding protein [Candidatus Omnitrophota bacterium]|nr:ATP-binding protein [Candidatus Omnitrophota bacterium]
MFSEPMVGEKFFGREEMLELLNKRVMALKDGYRQNIALTGQSLTGKSSIILHFLRMVKEDGFIPIYIEVIREPFRSFSNKFIATMLYNSLSKTEEVTDIDLENLLNRSQKAFPKTHLAIKGINSSIEKGDFEDAYSNLLGLTTVLKNETGLSCIVIFDEFDNLEHLGVKNPFLSFGKVIMVQKDTMYIVSSSRDAAIKKILSEKLSLLFGNFEVLKISNFDPDTAGEFINMKLAGFDIEGPLEEFLIAFTDGNPFYLNALASKAKGMAMERMSSYIDIDTITHSIVELVYSANGIIHQYLMNFILDHLDTKHRDTQISILTAIADCLNKQSDIARVLKSKRGEVIKRMAYLMESGMISKNGVFYVIDDAMLSFWLKFVYKRRKEILVDGTFDKTGLFEEDIKSYIANFSSEFKKTAIERIAELFNRFSNELVQVESKHIRLPHFTKVEIRQFQDSRPFIAASFRGSFWCVTPYEHPVSENDIINCIKNTKAIGVKISNRVIAPLKGIDENAKLLAKELRFSIWDRAAINELLGFYGKQRIVLL